MITKRFATTFAIMSVTLLGCSSFNRNVYLLPEAVYPLPMLAPTPVMAPVVALTDNKPACPVYNMPDIPPMPDLPLKELAAVRPDDDAAIDAVQQRHIHEIRRWAISTRKTLQESYEKYLKACNSLR